MSLGKHTFANFAGSMAPMLVALLTVPAYLQVIGTERFGMLAVVWTVLGYLGFMDLGLGRAVTQRISQLANDDLRTAESVLWTALAITFSVGSIGSLACWLLSNSLVFSFTRVPPGEAQEVLTAVRWVLVALPLLLMASSLAGSLQARLKFVELNLIQVGTGVTAQILPLVVALAGHTSFDELVLAALVPRVFAVGVLYLQCRTYLPLTRPAFYWGHVRPLINYGGWISCLTALGPLLVTADRLILASAAGARAVAHYTVPYDLVSRVMVLSGSLSSALFPRLAGASDQDSRALALRATFLLNAVMTPATAIGILLVFPFISLWIDAAFAKESRGVAEIILLGVWVNALVIPQHTRFLARENPRTVVIVLLCELPPYAAALWFAISAWGIEGAAAVWSTRVFADTMILLRLNRALLETMRGAALSASFVVAAFIVAFLDPSLAARFVTAMLLVAISVLKDWQLLVSLVPKLPRIGPSAHRD